VSSEMDGGVHREILASFVRRGYAPTLDEVASALMVTPDAVRAALRRLHDGHGLLLQPHSHEVWVAHPFAAAPSAVWVATDTRGWWAPCLWCAAGIVTLAAPNATICTRYAGEQEEAKLEVRDGESAGPDCLVHFALPPREAWSNVVHWCSTVLPFRSTHDVDAWSERHRLPRGALVPWSQVLALGGAWYGKHLDERWRKWSAAEAQAIFEQIGLRGEFWRLPHSDEPF
jgi:hypothetical protein